MEIVDRGNLRIGFLPRPWSGQVQHASGHPYLFTYNPTYLPHIALLLVWIWLPLAAILEYSQITVAAGAVDGRGGFTVRQQLPM